MLIEIVHNEPEITTVGDYVNRRDVSFVVDLTPTKLLDISHNGVTNRERVHSLYTVDEESEKNKPDASKLLKVGTVLFIPEQNINKETLFQYSQNTVQPTSFRSFLSDQLSQLLKDPQYKSIHRLNGNKGTVVASFPNITVWLWSRALGSEEDQEGLFFNLTPFVQSVQTNVGSNGGNFTLNLTPLDCEYDTERGWVIKKESIKNYNAGGLRDSFVAYLNSYRLTDKGLKQNRMFFHNIIQSNDLIFIRFETLDIEKERRLKQSESFFIDKAKDLPNNIYDMIGLVDSNSIVYNPPSNDISISITGRDLSKVFLEDGSYFFPLEFAQGVFYNAQGAGDAEQKLVQRSLVDGSLITLSAYLERSIQFSLQFIINQLSNTGLVPDSVFTGWGDRRSKKYVLEKRPLGNGEFQEQIGDESQSGVFQIIKLIFDESISNRRIVDSSIAQEQGSLINYIRKVCQEPFVEFLMDTYGDQFYCVVRKPPFDEQGIKALLNGDYKTERDYPDLNKNAVPSGLSQSVADSVNRYDAQIRRLIESDPVITIEEENLLGQQLSYDDKDVYSWYQLTPKGLFWGTGTEMTLAFTPAIYFPEYVDVWGSRPFSVVSNYIPFQAINDNNQKYRQNLIEAQAFYDLQYCIQSHSYLPFTRKGTITINGDRRIKRGTLIRLDSTNEIFYVDNVTNTYAINENSIDRVTVLQVSRGMVEDFIYGKSIDGIGRVSYFNIINTKIDRQLFVQNNGSLLNVISEWGVNKDVFNFFLKRRQWQ